MVLSSKTRSEHDECFGKVIYKTRKDAESEGKWIRRRGLWGGDKYPYFCKTCHAWHLTSEKNKKKGRPKYGED